MDDFCSWFKLTPPKRNQHKLDFTKNYQSNENDSRWQIAINKLFPSIEV